MLRNRKLSRGNSKISLIECKIKTHTLRKNQRDFISASKKRTYILIIFVSRNVEIKVGKLGKNFSHEDITHIQVQPLAKTQQVYPKDLGDTLNARKQNTGTSTTC